MLQLTVESNAVHLKVFLKNNNTLEAKRFAIEDVSVCKSFFFFKDKLQIVFPKLRENIFQITWKDIDGDDITIDSDQDLITAFKEMSGPLKIFYITVLKVKPDAASPLQRHIPEFPNVICDVCVKRITGYRYKCIQCHDYDLCASCEHNGHHSEHLMLRIPESNISFYILTKSIMGHINHSFKRGKHISHKEVERTSKYSRNPFEKLDTNKKHRECPKKVFSHHEHQESGNQANFNCAMGKEILNKLLPIICKMLEDMQHNLAIEKASVHIPNNNTDKSPPDNTNKNTDHNQTKSTPQEEPALSLIASTINNFLSIAQNIQKHSQEKKDSQYPPSSTEIFNLPEQNIPMDIEREVDLTSPPIEFIEINEQEPGWSTVYSTVNQQQTVTQPNPLSTEVAAGLKQLLDMGFTDELRLIALLRRFNGNVGEVVKYIFENTV